MTGEEKPVEQTKTLETFETLAPNEDPEIVTQVERLDEAQILESLKGRIIDKLFYEIDVRGNKQVALSWAGVKWFTLNQKHITIEKVEIGETEKTYRAYAWARDKVRDVRVMGAAEQQKNMRLRDERSIPDEYALPKVVSKAQRNALRGLIPETAISEALRLWKEAAKK